MDLSSIRTAVAPDALGDSSQYLPIFIVWGIGLVLSVILMRFRRRLVAAGKMAWLLAFASVIGFVIYWFRLEGVLYFDQNWLLAVPYILLIVGFIYILCWQLLKAPKVQLAKKHQEIKSQYLPKSKNQSVSSK